MDDLLKKLNVLLKTTINEMLTSGRDAETEGNSTPLHLTGDQANQQLTMLRQRINETMLFEDEIQSRILTLQSEVDRWNGTADEALTSSDDVAARYAVEQMNRAQQSLSMAQSDLREHQRVTEELVSHVNALEAAVESARQSQEQATPPLSESSPVSIGEAFSNTLEQMRDKINQISDQIRPTSNVTEEAPDASSNDQKIDDDLEQRRQRLSKPK